MVITGHRFYPCLDIQRVFGYSIDLYNCTDFYGFAIDFSYFREVGKVQCQPRILLFYGRNSYNSGFDFHNGVFRQ